MDQNVTVDTFRHLALPRGSRTSKWENEWDCKYYAGERVTMPKCGWLQRSAIRCLYDLTTNLNFTEQMLLYALILGTHWPGDSTGSPESRHDLGRQPWGWPMQWRLTSDLWPHSQLMNSTVATSTRSTSTDTRAKWEKCKKQFAQPLECDGNTNTAKNIGVLTWKQSQNLTKNMQFFLIGYTDPPIKKKKKEKDNYYGMEPITLIHHVFDDSPGWGASEALIHSYQWVWQQEWTERSTLHLEYHYKQSEHCQAAPNLQGLLDCHRCCLTEFWKTSSYFWAIHHHLATPHSRMLEPVTWKELVASLLAGTQPTFPSLLRSISPHHHQIFWILLSACRKYYSVTSLF